MQTSRRSEGDEKVDNNAKTRVVDEAIRKKKNQLIDSPTPGNGAQTPRIWPFANSSRSPKGRPQQDRGRN